MSEEQRAILERNLLEIFNERDETKRLAVIRALYTEHAIFFETDAAFQGLEQINRRVTEVLQTLPREAQFRVVDKPSKNHDVARLSWTLGAENGPTMASGMDVAVLEGERIAKLYLFIDPPPVGS
jgi:coproporphyrinogen III oxidase